MLSQWNRSSLPNCPHRPFKSSWLKAGSHPHGRPSLANVLRAGAGLPWPVDIGILAVTSLCLTPLPRELSPGLPPGCPPARKLLGAFVPGQGDGHFPRPAPSPSFLQASCGASCLHGCRSAGKTSWAGARKPRGRLHLRPQRPVFRDLHGPDHSPLTPVWLRGWGEEGSGGQHPPPVTPQP